MVASTESAHIREQPPDIEFVEGDVDEFRQQTIFVRDQLWPLFISFANINAIVARRTPVDSTKLWILLYCGNDDPPIAMLELMKRNQQPWLDYQIQSVTVDGYGNSLARLKNGDIDCRMELTGEGGVSSPPTEHDVFYRISDHILTDFQIA